RTIALYTVPTRRSSDLQLCKWDKYHSIKPQDAEHHPVQALITRFRQIHGGHKSRSQQHQQHNQQRRKPSQAQLKGFKYVLCFRAIFGITQISRLHSESKDHIEEGQPRIDQAHHSILGGLKSISVQRHQQIADETSQHTADAINKGIRKEFSELFQGLIS